MQKTREMQQCNKNILSYIVYQIQEVSFYICKKKNPKNPASIEDPLDGNAFEKWRTSQVYHFGKMYKMNGTSGSGF